MSSEETLREKVVDEYGNIRTDEQGFMDGANVFNFVIVEIPRDIKRLMKATGEDIQNMDYYVFHQANNFINSFHTHSENISLNVSPLLNPLYMGYSQSKGVSYKLDVGARYAWNPYRYLTLSPKLGYNFKGKQFYYTIPLRMTYNPKRNGYTELTWGNGNRTSHAALGEAFQKVMGDTISMPDFKDEYFQLVNNVAAFDWLEIMAGAIYHRRRSSNSDLM